MNNGPMLVIFPKDPTTDFLQDIVVYLTAEVTSRRISVLRIEPSDESHRYSLEQIEASGCASIVFLGHGSSTSLSGAMSNTYRCEKFISLKNINVFKGKKLVLLSCNSESLIKSAKLSGYDEAIGFGDLPTDWNDVQAAREYDVNAYRGFSQEIIEKFRYSLVEIIKFSLADFLNDGLTFKDLRNLMFLRLNKRIAKYYVSNREFNLPLSDALLKMKQETVHVINNMRLY